MSVRKKTIVVVAAVLLTTTCLVFGFSRHFLTNDAERMEALQVSSDLERIHGIVEYALQALESQTADWAAWDDLYQYMQDRNEKFETMNLSYESFVSNKVEMVALLDLSGQIIKGKDFNFEKQSEEPLSEGLEPYLAPSSDLVKFASIEDSNSGIALLKEGPMLLASCPIITSTRKGPSQGTLVMGRRLDAKRIKQFEELTRLVLDVRRVDDETLPSDMRDASRALSGGTPCYTRVVDKSQIAGYASIKDLLGHPALLLKVAHQRNSQEQLRTDLWYLLLGLGLTGVVACVLVALLLDRLILTRCAALTRFVSGLGSRKSLSERISMNGGDELSMLADSVNGMLAKIESEFEERLRAERAEIQAKQRYEDLVNNLPVGVYRSRLGAERCFLDANPALLAILRIDSTEELLSRPIEDFFKDPKKAVVIRDYLIQKGSLSSEVTELRTSKGDSIWVSISAAARRDDSGEIYFEGVVEDITKRKRAEEALRESESRLNAITDSAQDAILMIDHKGMVSYWNPAAERILGYTKDEAMGQDLHDLAAPQRFHEEYRSAFTEFQRSGQGRAVGRTLELCARRKDGQEIAVALSLSAVHINGGWNAVGILRDITEQKQAEAALIESNRQLAEATERANEMAVEAQAANIAKSQFLANMSHEIRTPMNGVIGMTGLLMDSGLTEEQRQYAEVVRTSGEALLSVVNDILDFSKIESGKLDLEELDFDLRVMLEDAAELIAVRAHEKRLDFVCHIDPEVPTFLRGDPGRLRQILLNLGGNAVKFTAKGEVIIDVQLESEDDEHAKILFEVRDTGIGIPEDKIGILFNAFQQVDGSTARRFGGTGLGLAISKRLAALMGGEIGIESVEGQGSTCWFTSVFAKQPPRDRNWEKPRADVRGVHALAVDDNATNRLVLSEQLTSWGVRHAEAESAEQALQMLRDAEASGDPFRIVLTDMQMPDMDGEALGVAIKSDTSLRDTLLVMMTSLGKRGDGKRLEAIGFAAYLTKPVKQSQLYDCLSTLLGASSSAGKPSETALVTRHTISESRRRKIRILLAEDNPTNQMVALRLLEKQGFRADVVANGQEALRSLETLPYDLVFMDVQMPVMDGVEAARMIRSGKTRIANPKLPIVAMTAHAMKGDRELCIEAGMDDYISKPISAGALVETLNRWLGGDRDPDSLLAAVVRQQTSPVEGKPIFDRAAFLELLSGDEDLATEIMDGFMEDLGEQIDRLKKHVGDADAELAGRQGHTIKGAAANVRCMALSAVAFEIEKAGRAGRLDDILALMSELDRQYEVLKEQVAVAATC